MEMLNILDEFFSNLLIFLPQGFKDTQMIYV